MKILRYIKALILWSIWLIFHRFETRRRAIEMAGKDCPYYDPHGLGIETEARVFAIQLDLEEKKFRELLGEKS
jgi:hypothetical protein